MNAFLACLYLSGGMAYVAPMPSHDADWVYWYDLQSVHNPYGTVAIGCGSEPERRWSASIEARHFSSIPVRDNGINSIQIHLTWRPFRHE